MYEDNKYQIKINWKNVLLIVGLIALVIIVIMLLMPKSGSNDAYFQQAFNSNLSDMKSAAKSYYTASSENLPKNIGDSTTISLENMVEQKLVTAYTDKNNNECDQTNSYAQVKKTGSNEYVLKTQLSCDTKSDYVLETITTSTATSQADGNTTDNSSNNTTDNNSTNTDNNTTNDNSANNINNSDDDEEDYISDGETVDKDGNIIKKVTEYEFKKPIYNSKTVYRCEDSSYTLSGNKCYKTITESPIPATPIYFDDTTTVTDAKKNEIGGYDEKADVIKEEITTTKCPEGYTENGDTCIKYVEATVTPGSTEYYCSDSSFTYNEKTKLCEKRVTPNVSTVTKTEYTCVNSSDTLSGTTCTYASTANISNKETCTCPDGYTESWLGTCYKKNTTQNCTCPSGYEETISGQCRKAINSAQTCTCPSGYEETTSGQCRKQNGSSSSYKASYDNGKWLGRFSYDKSGVSGNTKIECSKKTVSGQTYYECTQYTATCSNGGTLNSSGYCVTGSSSYTYANKSCTGGGTTYQYANKSCSNSNTYDYASKSCSSTSETTYSCDARSGKNPSLNYYKSACSYTANSETKTETVYTCDTANGYTLDSSTNTCVKTVEPDKKQDSTTYSCPTGYTLEGTTCYVTTNKESETTYKYSCPEGYTANGTGENMTCTKHIESTEEWYCEDKDAVLDKDKKTCTKTIKGGIKGYKCPNDTDYILDGEYCTLKTLDCKDAIADTEETVTYQYKWSTETEIEGWVKTGNTREKAVISSKLNK